MRLSPLLLLALLAGCTTQQLVGLPPPAGPEFGVSSLPSPLPEPFASFDRVGPEAAAFHAKSVCTLGYRSLGDAQMAGDPGPILATRIRCNDYVPWLANLVP